MVNGYDKKLYKVKRGQTVVSLAKEVGVTPYLLVSTNRLTGEIFEGQLLFLPGRGNLYTVREGDTKALLCGGKESYEKKNGTDIFYLGMRVLL